MLVHSLSSSSEALRCIHDVTPASNGAVEKWNVLELSWSWGLSSEATDQPLYGIFWRQILLPPWGQHVCSNKPHILLSAPSFFSPLSLSLDSRLFVYPKYKATISKPRTLQLNKIQLNMWLSRHGTSVQEQLGSQYTTTYPVNSFLAVNLSEYLNSPHFGLEKHWH